MTFFRTSKQVEIDTWIQDQTTQPIHYFLMNEIKNDITLTSAVSKGDSVISVSAGHGFTAGGEFIALWEDDRYMQQEVESVSTNDISIGTEAPYPFTTNAVIIRGSVDMNVNGSVTPVQYQYYKRSGLPIDFQRIHITIWNDAAQGDDGSFGDLTALTNGIRAWKDTDTYNGNLGVFKNNSDFRDYGGAISYNDKSGGGGNYGIDVCFQLKEHYGIVVRFDPDNTEKFIVEIRDDLTDLDRLRISLMGQVTIGE